MLQYQVGFYFSDGDIKSPKIFSSYEMAFDDYLDRLKTEFHKLGAVSSSLGIGYIQDNELIGIEKLKLVNTDS